MKKALVIVSFGTTYERARRSIDAVERALAQAAEGYDVFRAYTSSIVRKVLKSRGEIVPSLEEALENWRTKAMTRCLFSRRICSAATNTTKKSAHRICAMRGDSCVAASVNR